MASQGRQPNRSLNLTPHKRVAGQAPPRAGFSVRREYGQGSMLIVIRFCGNYRKMCPSPQSKTRLLHKTTSAGRRAPQVSSQPLASARMQTHLPFSEIG